MSKLSLISERLKEILEREEISQQIMAMLLGTTQQTVSRWIAGTNEPDIDNIIRICYTFGETPDTLLGFDIMNPLEIIESDPILSRPFDSDINEKIRKYKESLIIKKDRP